MGDIKTSLEMTSEPVLVGLGAGALFRRTNIRDLYKRADHKVLPWKMEDICHPHITTEAIVEAETPFAACDV
ncbi:hypothetical protein PHLCEN_2v5785 [Hermanssonia centrifuga]|uniref:Uncharacterized protein n=1 Tax=Hermanssonia centrifuga TaxID=98765 RepID=A0A2R6P1H0_9APHY|nr:hypothetical protein PHLCEN_2v5785 [Hermanssonia centrifuga]